MSFALFGPQLHGTPMRIVSLVPSLTEAVTMLGRSHLLVGRTDYCVSPREVVSLPSVGGTKTAALERILALNPDLILAAKEENPKKLVAKLAASTPVLVVNPQGPQDIPQLWRTFGELLGARPEGMSLASETEEQLRAIQRAVNRRGRRPRFAYLVWKDPWMAAGPATYVGSLLAFSGFTNAVAAGPRRYPVVSPEALLAAHVQLLLFPDEPYPFRLPEAAAGWNLSLAPLALPHRLPLRAQGQESAWEGSLRFPAFLLGGRLLAVEVSGAAFTWYPSQTSRGLALANFLAEFVLELLQVFAEGDKQ